MATPTKPPLTNEELDAKVLASIQGGHSRQVAIMLHLKLGPKDMRPVDRSLQRLRRRNEIKYGAEGWHALEEDLEFEAKAKSKSKGKTGT